MDKKTNINVGFVGGHLSPLLAVLSNLPETISPFVIGRKYPFANDKTVSLEYKVLSSMKIPFYSISPPRLARFNLLSLVKSFVMPIFVVQCIRILILHRPNVVVSFGGYVSLPVVFAAYILGIPIVIHEQTLDSGLANKIAGLFARKVCISWESSAKYFPKNKVVLTGNPIREFTKKPVDLPKGELPLVYVTGGSGGAHAINLLVEESLFQLLSKYRIVHQTGDAKEYGDYERMEEQRSLLATQMQDRYMVAKFVEPSHIGYILSQADVVLGRSGMNTITELLYFAKKCVLIPLQHGQKGEQEKNAQFLKDIGIASVLPQDIVSGTLLLQEVDKMARLRLDSETVKKSKSLVHIDAAKQIINQALLATK